MDVKRKIRKALHKTGDLFEPKALQQHRNLYKKYSDFTMIPERLYMNNLAIAEKSRQLEGSVVECGVWRGGMIAGIAELIGKEKHYYLYDSFEGLPEAKAIDGASAIEWQNNTQGETYFNNCKAEMAHAEKAMQLSGAPFTCVKGWFADTVPQHTIPKISLLRLDGDWYDSTRICLEYFYPRVVSGGVIIIDDYHTWDGCSKAVHDYLSSIGAASRISSIQEVAYIIKKD